MPSRTPVLAVSLFMGLAAALTACASSSHSATPAATASSARAVSASTAKSASSATPAPSATPVAVPAGYKRIGGSVQGISIAAPSSWPEVNLAQDSIAEITSKLHLSGVSGAQLKQSMENLQKLHAIEELDMTEVAAHPGTPTSDINAYCTSSGVTETGAAGVPILKSLVPAEYKKMGALDVSVADATIGGIPGTEVSYQLSTNMGTAYGMQLEVLPKPDKACFVTLTGPKKDLHMLDGLIQVAARTARFP